MLNRFYRITCVICFVLCAALLPACAARESVPAQEAVPETEFVPGVHSTPAEPGRTARAEEREVPSEPDASVIEADVPPKPAEPEAPEPPEQEILPETAAPEVVDLMGEAWELSEMKALREDSPDTAFLFRFSLKELTGRDISADSLTESLDLSGMTLADPEVLREYLSFMPSLKELLMLDCSYSNSQLTALREEYPELSIVWRLRFREKYKLRTDAVSFSTLASDGDYPHLYSGDCEILRCCTELMALDVGEHSIEDISFLESLPRLRVLIVALNDISDISPIASLKELRYLELFGNPRIDSLEALRGLTKLEDLNISYLDRVTDLEPLYGLKSLRRLWMNRCPISEEALAELRAQLPECEIKCVPTGFACGEGWRMGEKYQAIRRTFANNYLDPIFNDGVEVWGKQ